MLMFQGVLHTKGSFSYLKWFLELSYQKDLGFSWNGDLIRLAEKFPGISWGSEGNLSLVISLRKEIWPVMQKHNLCERLPLLTTIYQNLGRTQLIQKYLKSNVCSVCSPAKYIKSIEHASKRIRC